MKTQYLVDFDGVILDSQARFDKDMKGHIDEDWLDYLISIKWYEFLRECEEIDGSLSTLVKLQKYKKLKGIITAIHSMEEGKQKLIFLREKNIEVPIFYTLTGQQKNEIYIPTPEIVLVDDKQKNITNWENADGRALLFDPGDVTNDKKIIKSLKQLL